ncbi:MAG: nucleoside-triphosphatase [Lentihominibacter sp.]
MNNLFIEGPIQRGKSTLIREVLKKFYGPGLDGCTAVAGGRGVGGFTVQRMTFPTQGADKRFGFRLMEASAPIRAHTCVVAADEDLLRSDGVFKVIGPSGGRTNMKVFETKAVTLMEQAAVDAAKGRISMILLDEIGGHELACPSFCNKLYELLDSDIPCIGVIKHPDSARRMDPAIANANEELHKKITGPHGEHGEILYFDAPVHCGIPVLSNNDPDSSGDAVRTALEEFIARFI